MTDTAASAAVLCERLLVGVTGSPASLSMPQHVLMLRQALVGRVDVMMTHAAQQFVLPDTMRRFADGRVYTDCSEISDDVSVPHIELTQAADLFLIMPATANIIGKAAAGICDDLISTSIVACPAPVVMVPAMNETMWRSAVVQRNVATIRELGYHVIDPGIGLQLADNDVGIGTMLPLEHILGDLIDIVGQRDRTSVS